MLGRFVHDMNSYLASSFAFGKFIELYENKQIVEALVEQLFKGLYTITLIRRSYKWLRI